MRIAIIGGTGAMGSGLAAQLSRKHDVRIGSRSEERAKGAAARIPNVTGDADDAAASWCEAAIAAVPFTAVRAMKEFGGSLAGKLVLSVINPLRMEGGLFRYGSEGRSAAELLAAALPRSFIATAFNNVPVGFLIRPPREETDVLVAADSKRTYGMASEIVRSVPRMRPLYVGPLTQAESVERVTVMVLNAARLAGRREFSVRFVSGQAGGPA